MKVATVALAVAMTISGMMVVGAFVPDLDPAPTAQAHSCDSDDYTCIAACVPHQFIKENHGCQIKSPATAQATTLAPGPLST